MFRALGCRGVGFTVSESTVLELYGLHGESSGLRVSPHGPGLRVWRCGAQFWTSTFSVKLKVTSAFHRSRRRGIPDCAQNPALPFSCLALDHVLRDPILEFYLVISDCWLTASGEQEFLSNFHLQLLIIRRLFQNCVIIKCPGSPVIPTIHV